MQPSQLETNTKWKDRLGLSTRSAPDLYEDEGAVGNTPYAGVIRTALQDLKMSAVFCVQNVPTIMIRSVEEYRQDEIVNLHTALWNQGLANLLLIFSGDNQVRPFSLARVPYSDDSQDFDSRCLIEESYSTGDYLKNIIYEAESGLFWENHAEYFKPEDRIDQVLLNNLTTSNVLLCKQGLLPNAAQALLIQTMFIAYLEDRRIIDSEYFQKASKDESIDKFSKLLGSSDADSLIRLFERLRGDINGNIFVEPCSFEETNTPSNITRDNLGILERFHSGKEIIETGQFRIWRYNFKYIPIELISAVYDRFLSKGKRVGSQKQSERRIMGAYYTPMFLADITISETWKTLSTTTKDRGHFLDPACGSGMFLVRLFQRLCEHRRESQGNGAIIWDDLCDILSRLHGLDLDESAVRVAIFSLYIAILEEIDPPSIRELIKNRRLLPNLWNKNLRHQDFFKVLADERFDVLIGNPPWSSRHGTEERPSVKWCHTQDVLMPAKEESWAFAWKSLQHLKNSGITAFLLPAMGFLHNHAGSALKARKIFFKKSRIRCIINFSDLRFQLFADANRPTTLIIFEHDSSETSYQFEYWVPKSDLNLKTKQVITLRETDKCLITSQMVEDDPHIFKTRLWMSAPEARLFNYLSELPKLSDLVHEFKNNLRAHRSTSDKWIIGMGFSTTSKSRYSKSRYSESINIIANTPFLPSTHSSALVQIDHGLNPWRGEGDKIYIYRKGFIEGFKKGPRVLISRGGRVRNGLIRLCAAYVEDPLTFLDGFRAILVPYGEERRAKLLTALLNSRMIAWFAFHGTASFGAERPEVKQSEMLRIPFPSPKDMLEEECSRKAEEEMISIIDKLFRSPRVNIKHEIFKKIDRLAYKFFCLSDDEIILVDDTVEKIIPSIQPKKGDFREIWRPSTFSARKEYAETLILSLYKYFNNDVGVKIRVEAHNKYLFVLHLSLQGRRQDFEYVEEDNDSVNEVLSDIYKKLPRETAQRLPGNFQLDPFFRIFNDKDLYLVKPDQKRFWLKSMAIVDANSIACDFHRNQSHDNERDQS